MAEETVNKSKVVWDAESTHPELASKVRDGLREVVDPEIGLNIVELGLVRNLTIQDDVAQVNMIMTTPFCPYGPALLEMTRKKTQDVTEMPTSIDMGLEVWDPSCMEEGAGADWGLF